VRLHHLRARVLSSSVVARMHSFDRDSLHRASRISPHASRAHLSNVIREILHRVRSTSASKHKRARDILGARARPRVRVDVRPTLPTTRLRHDDDDDDDGVFDRVRRVRDDDDDARACADARSAAAARGGARA